MIQLDRSSQRSTQDLPILQSQSPQETIWLCVVDDTVPDCDHWFDDGSNCAPKFGELHCRVKQEAEELQIKWGEASCQRLALANAGRILTRRISVKSDDSSESRPVQVKIPYQKTSTILGVYQFDILLSDEQAKANVNLLSVNRSEAKTRQLVQELLTGVDDIPIMLRKGSPNRSGIQRNQFHSWGQVFDLATQESNSYNGAILEDSTKRVTLWGPAGKLHFEAADEMTLRIIASLALTGTKANELIELRNEHPDKQLKDIVDMMELNLRERERLNQVLTDRSQCYSVWVTSGNARSRIRRTLVVSDTIGNSARRIYSWKW